MSTLPSPSRVVPIDAGHAGENAGHGPHQNVHPLGKSVHRDPDQIVAYRHHHHLQALRRLCRGRYLQQVGKPDQRQRPVTQDEGLGIPNGKDPRGRHEGRLDDPIEGDAVELAAQLGLP